jgi:hypothetical protein
VNRRKGTSECRVLEQCELGRGGTSREAVDSVTKAGGGINTKESSSSSRKGERRELTFPVWFKGVTKNAPPPEACQFTERYLQEADTKFVSKAEALILTLS